MDLGVLAKAVPIENLDEVVWAEIEPYLSCAPAAVARAKALLRNLGPVIDETVIQHSISELAACWAGGEAPEGIAAFFDKRPPIWD
jgi:methylglutaconyl-CoA hydratase